MSVYTEEGDVTNEDILIWKKVPVSSGFAVSKWRRKWLTPPEFCPEDSTDRGAWWAAVRWVTERGTQLSDGAGAVSKRGSGVSPRPCEPQVFTCAQQTWLIPGMLCSSSSGWGSTFVPFSGLFYFINHEKLQCSGF